MDWPFVHSIHTCTFETLIPYQITLKQYKISQIPAGLQCACYQFIVENSWPPGRLKCDCFVLKAAPFAVLFAAQLDMPLLLRQYGMSSVNRNVILFAMGGNSRCRCNLIVPMSHPVTLQFSRKYLYCCRWLTLCYSKLLSKTWMILLLLLLLLLPVSR